MAPDIVSPGVQRRPRSRTRDPGFPPPVSSSGPILVGDWLSGRGGARLQRRALCEDRQVREDPRLV